MAELSPGKKAARTRRRKLSFAINQVSKLADRIGQKATTEAIRLVAELADVLKK